MMIPEKIEFLAFLTARSYYLGLLFYFPPVIFPKI